MEDISSLSEVVLSLVNSLFSSLFSSIDSNLYFILDSLIFIDTSIFEETSINEFLNINTENSLILICNALMAGILIYYCISHLLSHITYFKTQSFHFFIFRIILCTILLNYSLSICRVLVDFINIISSNIIHLGELQFATGITFSNFIEVTSNYSFSEDFNLFSFEGILQSFYSFGFFNLLLSYSLRFILVRLFILISPFAFLSLAIDKFSSFFINWLKGLVGLLSIQIIIALILLLGFSLNLNFNYLLNQVLFLGIIFAISKANQITIELIGGINTSINTTFNTVFKHN